MMHMAYKLGSLFDGSGGFPLAGSLCGVEPVWASEVEPYPIAVTRSRFPNMRHLGDISKVNGGEIEPVDIITFGSPCQDLSVAGKRAGLKHEANGDEETTRSGLFMEAVRIIKEMREATNGEYPTFALWENVPGAFSSNRGEDFRTVLEELIKIVEPAAVMPAVPKNGWPYADSYCGDGWSLSYRIFDAQYWGVPQRRRRIHLVLDLRGERAREVLFEREGVRGYFAEGRTPRQSLAGDAQNCTGADNRTGDGFDGYNGDITGDVSATIGVNCGVSTGRNGVIERRERLDAVSGGFCPEQSAKTRGIGWEEETAPTLRAGVVPGVVHAVTLEPGIEARKGGHIYENVSGTLRADAGDNRMAVAYSFDSLASNSMKSKNPHSGCRQVDVAKTLDTTDPNHCKNQGGIAVVEIVPYNLKIRCGCEGGGKGALIQKDMSATLATNNDQYLFQPIAFTQNQRDEVRDLNDKTSVVCEEIHIHDKATRYKGGGSTRNGDGAGNGLGVGKPGDPVPTLSTCDHHMVCYCMATQRGGAEIMENLCPTITDSAGMSGNNQPVVCMAHGQANAEIIEDKCPCLSCNHEQPIVFDKEVYNSGIKATGGHYIAEGGKAPTLRASVPPGVCIRYIVRRLTPTECARLQGFPDNWGHPDQKEYFTDEEYRFWLEVRNAYAAINGKAIKDYTEEQMLTWYNKLHTDSAEYKMWGNGIALPPALYCMQGIVDEMNREEDD